jgi:hypothetical protein
LAALVAYTAAIYCRQVAIARHFGERLPVERCGVCDRCRGASSPAGGGKSAFGRRPRPPRVRDDAIVRETIQACLRDLPYAVGVSGLVRVLRGSADVAPAATMVAQFGALAGVGKTRLAREIEALIAEGALERDAAGEYPLLRLRTH